MVAGVLFFLGVSPYLPLPMRQQRMNASIHANTTTIAILYDLFERNNEPVLICNFFFDFIGINYAIMVSTISLLLRLLFCMIQC